MMKRTVRLLVFAMALVCLLTTVSAASGNVVATGSCGTNVTYTLYEDGELVISGNGAMDNMDSSDSKDYPWYSNCDIIKAVTIEDGVTNIGTYAFSYYYPALTEVTIGSDVESIGENAFFRCGNLASVTIPGNVTTIGKNAFSECENLTSVVMEHGVTSIGESAFAHDKNLISVTIPASVTTIGNQVFFYCESLTDVTLPEGITSVGNYMFEGCISLTDMTLPDSVESIGMMAFRECQGLTSLTIPGNVTTIGQGAFYGCKGLTSLTIPDNVKSLGKDAFYKCAGLTEVTIGSGVTNFGSNVFADCSQLTELVIKEGATSIGDGAFCWTALTHVTIPDSVITIGGSAFGQCPQLTDVVVGDGVTTIGSYAFSQCNVLTDVRLGRGVTSLGEGAFFWCSELERVEFAGDAPTVGKDVFYFSDKVSIYYHEGTAGWPTDGVWQKRPLVVQEHTEQVLPAVASTCTQTGLTEGLHCSVCKLVQTEQELVPALGHDYIDHAAKAPTIESVGWKAYQTCSRCDYSTYVELPKVEVFDVVVGGSSSDTIVLDKVSGAAGEEVTVTVTPPKGYVVKEIRIDGVPIAGNTFIITGDHEVVVIYEKIPFGYFSLQVVNTIIVDGQSVDICRWVWTPFEE